MGNLTLHSWVVPLNLNAFGAIFLQEKSTSGRGEQLFQRPGEAGVAAPNAAGGAPPQQQQQHEYEQQAHKMDRLDTSCTRYCVFCCH